MKLLRTGIRKESLWASMTSEKGVFYGAIYKERHVEFWLSLDSSSIPKFWGSAELILHSHALGLNWVICPVEDKKLINEGTRVFHVSWDHPLSRAAVRTKVSGL